MDTGRTVAHAVAGSDAPRSDAVSKLLSSLEQTLMPHRKEEMVSKTAKYSKILAAEHKKGELRVRPVDSGVPKNRRARHGSRRR